MRKTKRLKVTTFFILISIILLYLIPYIFFTYIARSWDPRGGSGDDTREENRRHKIEACEQISTYKFPRKLCFIWKTQKEITMEYDTTMMKVLWCTIISDGNSCVYE